MSVSYYSGKLNGLILLPADFIVVFTTIVGSYIENELTIRFSFANVHLFAKFAKILIKKDL